MSGHPTYIIVQRRGQVPERKGGFRDSKQVEAMLRELYEIDPGMVCIVISMPEDCWPTHGREWISMYGDRRRKPLPPAPKDGVQECRECAIQPCDTCPDGVNPSHGGEQCR